MEELQTQADFSVNLPDYSGKENEKLWREVKDYIEGRYDTEVIERIYFQSDGGSWMKKRIQMLGGTFVVDEFHMKKYVKRMVRVSGEEREEGVLKYLERGERKKLKEWSQEKGKDLEEKKRKRLEESVGYIEKNWKGIRMRIKREEGVMGSSTESYFNHVLSARMSSRPMEWSKEGGRETVRAKDLLEERKKDRRTVEERKGGRGERGRSVHMNPQIKLRYPDIERGLFSVGRYAILANEIVWTMADSFVWDCLAL